MELTKTQKLFQQVIEKAWEDETFKKELVADPVSAIEKLTGNKIKLPEGKTLVMEDVELNEEQLEAVAGGKGAPVFTFPWDDIIIIDDPVGPFDPISTGPYL